MVIVPSWGAHLDPEEAHRISDVRVIAGIPCLPPLQLIRWSRLCLLAKVVVRGSDLLRHLLVAGSSDPDSWLALVWEDLRAISVLSPFADFCEFTFFQWVSHIKSHPRAFKKRVHTALASPQAREPSFWAEPRWLEERTVPWPCYLCGSE